jgi:hypothetical protein
MINKVLKCLPCNRSSTTSPNNLLLIIAYQNKNIHLIGWTLSTWPSLFHDTDWDADIDRSKTVYRLWYRSVHGFWTGQCRYIKLQFLLGFVIFCAFILCVQDSDIQYNKHNSYWYVRKLVDFLIPWIISVHLYCVCQTLVFNAIDNSYWYGWQYQDRQTSIGSWYGPWYN